MFKMPLMSYQRLETSLICFVDALGNPYLMPCLCQNPCLTQDARDSHQHVDIMLEEESMVAEVP